MSHANNNWQHYAINVNNAKANNLILEFLKSFPNSGYIDRVNNNEITTVKFHLNTLNNNISKDLQTFQQMHNLHEIPKYKLADDISELFSGPAAEEIYLKASVDSMSCVSDLINNIESNNKLADIAFVIMSLYILHPDFKSIFFSDNNPESVPFTFLSFRSHSDGYFIRTNQEAKYRSKFETMFQEKKITYIKRFNKVKQDYQQDNLSPMVNEWLILINKLFPIIVDAVNNKQIDFIDVQSGFIADNYELSAENFHQKTKNSHDFYQYIREDKRMKALRLITGIMYLTLHRLGLSYLERIFLCYVISRTVEAAYHTDIDSALTIVSQAITHHYQYETR